MDNYFKDRLSFDIATCVQTYNTVDWLNSPLPLQGQISLFHICLSENPLATDFARIRQPILNMQTIRVSMVQFRLVYGGLTHKIEPLSNTIVNFASFSPVLNGSCSQSSCRPSQPVRQPTARAIARWQRTGAFVRTRQSHTWLTPVVP